MDVTRIVLFAALAVLVVVALAGAVLELARGRRPVLLARPA
jgi:hypothetical protein